MMNDVFITESRHTAVPDWIALRQDIPWQARNLAHVILIKSRGPLLPTRDDLAEAMGVEVRTIDRWLADLRSFGMLRTNQAGRRNFFILTDSDSTPTPDPCDQRSMRSAIHAISDPCDQGLEENSEQFLEHQEDANGQFSEESIADPPVGVVVGSNSLKEKRTNNNNRAPLKTPLGRWLKQAGMNAARHFDDPALDYWTYVKFVQEKRAAGWEWRQIVSTLREAPLDRDPHAAPIDLDQADDQVTPAPALAGRSIEDAQARWEARRKGKL